MSPSAFIAPLPLRRTARVIGRHRLRFLNAMTSTGLLKATAGDCLFATMSNATGKHIGLMRLEVGAEELTLVSAADSFERLLAGLTKHRVADDIRWQPAETPRAVLGLYGDSDASLEAAFAQLFPSCAAPAAGRYIDIDGALRACRFAAAFSELERPVIYIRALGETDEALEALRSTAGSCGVTLLDDARFEVARIEALWPDSARDLPEDEPTLGSTRLIATVDWDKGCFLGQEVFVMARDRGEPPKKLIALTCAGPAPEPGAAIHHEKGGVAGRVGSALTTADGSAVLLALVKRRFSGGDATLSLEDGRPLQR